MAGDIYGAIPTFGGAFAMDEATLTFALGSSTDDPDGGLGFLIQSVNVSYNRPVQRIFELGPTKTTYYVAGRSEGRMQISRLAAPAPVHNTFLTRFADVCNVAQNTMTIEANPATCTTDTGIGSLTAGFGANGTLNGRNVVPSRYLYKFCLIDGLSFSISTQSLALTENLSLVFASMENKSDTGGSSA